MYAMLGIGTIVSIVLFGAYIHKCRAHDPAPLQVVCSIAHVHAVGIQMCILECMRAVAWCSVHTALETQKRWLCHKVWLRTYRRRIFDAAFDAPSGGDKLV